jgi:hypothetical protein
MIEVEHVDVAADGGLANRSTVASRGVHSTLALEREEQPSHSPLAADKAHGCKGIHRLAGVLPHMDRDASEN